MNRTPGLLLCALAIGALACTSIPGRAADGQRANVVQTVALGYQEDRQTEAFRTSISAVDTKTAAFLLTLPTFDAEGRKNVSVTPCLSASGATVSFRLAFRNVAGTDILGITDPLTWTSSDVTNAAGQYLCPTYTFSSTGFYKLTVICSTAPSSGTCPALNVGSY